MCVYGTAGLQIGSLLLGIGRLLVKNARFVHIQVPEMLCSFIYGFLELHLCLQEWSRSAAMEVLSTNMRQFFGHIQYNIITISNYTIDSLNQNTHTL